MKQTTLKVSEIKNNPNNPRLIKDDKFKKLVQSLKDFPIMAKKLRKIVVDENNIILGGNMRFRAIKEAGIKEVHVEYFTREDAEENNRLAKELDPAYVDKTYEEQCREFIIKDNVSGGEWDMDILANEWDTEELEEWGVEIIKTNFDDIDSFFEDNEGEAGDKKHKQTTCPECGYKFEA
jgi:ParB-like chromosome segregation protein Spo0J